MMLPEMMDHQHQSNSFAYEPTEKTWLETSIMNILKCGQIPRHVAFIMDGNRRYANKVNISRAEGHHRGLMTLNKVLDWCKDFNIPHVTLFAFSLENFKRTPNEVDDIMSLSRQKLDAILNDLGSVNKTGIKIRIIGDKSRLPEDLQERVDKIQELTANNNTAYLNICLAYNSSYEMMAVMKELNQMVNDGHLKSDAITMGLFEQKLAISHPFPELIIRTSEMRLSNFMIWQLSNSVLMFIDALWPEITIWDMFKAIFYFQVHNKFKLAP